MLALDKVNTAVNSMLAERKLVSIRTFSLMLLCSCLYESLPVGSTFDDYIVVEEQEENGYFA